MSAMSVCSDKAVHFASILSWFSSDEKVEEEERNGGDFEGMDDDEKKDNNDSDSNRSITVSVSNNGLSNYGYIQFTAGQLVNLKYINPASINLGLGVNIETEIIHPNFPNSEWNNQLTITPFYSPTKSMSVFGSEPLTWGIFFTIHSDTGLIDINIQSNFEIKIQKSNNLLINRGK